MPCQSAPISQRSAAVSESTGSFPAWQRRMAARFFSDAEPRAAPVSPSNEVSSARQETTTSRRLRPRLSARPSQQRPAHRGTVGAERTASDSLRLRDLATSGQRSDSEPGQAPLAGDSAPQPAVGGLRHRHRRAPGSSGNGLSDLEDGTHDAPEAGKAPASKRRRRVTATPALALIRLYQVTISPSLGNVCRFQPTCSHYAYEAIERHGLLKGVWLAARRLISCRPGGRTGYDPVPD